MTTPTRWSAETEELVARALFGHFDEIIGGEEPATAQLSCSCGGFSRTMPAVSDWEPHMVEFRHHKAAAILTALADAGALMPVGGERLGVSVDG